MAPFEFHMDESSRQKWILPVQFQEELKRQIKTAGPQRLDDWWNFFENEVEDEYTRMNSR